MTRKVLALGFEGEKISEDDFEIVLNSSMDGIPNFGDFDIIILGVGYFFLPQRDSMMRGLGGPTLTEEGRRRKNVERMVEKEVVNSLEEGKIICFISENKSDELFERIMKKINVGWREISEEVTDLDIKRSEFTGFGTKILVFTTRKDFDVLGS